LRAARPVSRHRQPASPFVKSEARFCVAPRRAPRYSANMTRPRFHLAFPVRDLAKARAFYGGLLGCPEGRSSSDWIDFDFYGHQIVAHLAPEEAGHRSTNAVDGEDVPVRHFGAILTLPEWQAMVEKLEAAKIQFVIEPQIRFVGEPGEQATMFFLDPSGNAIEFKAFADDAMVFAR
jgi:extradiol dioxygenase family protein